MRQGGGYDVPAPGKQPTRPDARHPQRQAPTWPDHPTWPDQQLTPSGRPNSRRPVQRATLPHDERERERQATARRNRVDFVVNMLLLLFVLIGLIGSVAVALWAHDVSHAYRDATIEARIRGYTRPSLTLLAQAVSVPGLKPVIALTVPCLCGLLLLLRRPMQAATYLMSVGGGVLLDLSFKPVVARLGPGATSLPPGPFGFTDYSFPSGHTLYYLTSLVPLAWFLWEWRPQGTQLWRTLATLGRLALCGGLLMLIGAVGLARIYLGVHWPSDVVGGYALGAFWSALVMFAYLRFRERSPVPAHA